MNPNLNYALALAAQGLPVFPVWHIRADGACACGADHPDGKNAGKHPMTPRGLNDASTDVKQIETWWTIAPEANIGVAVPDGVIVVDVDPRNGGEATFAALERLPETRWVFTGGKGAHFYLRVPPGLAFPGRLGEGVDVKQLGGYVLAPPSNHTGGTYRWATAPDARIADAPPWLVALGRPRGERSRVIVEDEEDRTSDDATLDRIVAAVEPRFIEGKKHHIAKNLGGWMKQRGYGPADVAYVVERLPSKNPQARAKAAVAAFGIERAFGWNELKELVGEAPAAALDACTPNPRRSRELEERAAAQGLVQAMAAAVPVQAPPPPLPTGGIVERLRGLQNQGPRRPTGIPPLDRALRGGMREEKVMIIGGAPGAGKTSLARQIADYMARTGVVVGWLASDEEPEDIDMRRLQAIGVPRHVAEQPDEATLQLAARELQGLPFVMFDAQAGWTIETAFAELGRLYPDQPRMFVIDSLQTVQTARTTSIDSKRERIDDVLATAKQLCRAPATRCFVIFTSELARGAYRSESSVEATSDISAFKESGGIEYAGQVLLVLRSVKGDGQFVDVTMPKNRLGTKLDFLLKLDLDTTNLTESFENPHDASIKAAAEAAIPSVQEVLGTVGWPGCTQSALEKQCGRKAEVVRACLRLMVERKIAKVLSGPRGALMYMLATVGEAANDTRSAAPPPLQQSTDELADALYAQREAR